MTKRSKLTIKKKETLKKLAQNCEFEHVDSEIKAQVIQHCTSTKLRRKGLNDPTVSGKYGGEYWTNLL